MSRTALKKELRNLNAEQLRELLEDMYDFRLTPKEYFSFYLNPDAEALLERHRKAIDTELRRRSYRGSKARISVINNIVKNFDSYKAGLDYNQELKFYTLRRLMQLERYTHVPAPVAPGICRLVAAIIKEADLNLSADKAMATINALLSGPEYGTPALKEQIADTLRAMR